LKHLLETTAHAALTDGSIRLERFLARQHSVIFNIQFQNGIEVFGIIENECVIDRLATLRSATATRQKHHALFTAKGNGCFNTGNFFFGTTTSGGIIS
jgi:hypothetical protein